MTLKPLLDVIPFFGGLSVSLLKVKQLCGGSGESGVVPSDL